MNEPIIKVGLIEDKERISFKVDGVFDVITSAETQRIKDKVTQTKEVIVENGKLRLVGVDHGHIEDNKLIKIVPLNSETTINVYGVTIGRKFHWQRDVEQIFVGDIWFKLVNNKIMVINLVPLEKYVTSVISSEMSAKSPTEYLKTHAVISRSWVLSQIEQAKKNVPNTTYNYVDETTILRWYGREGHNDYDICNDDHCQRYHGFEHITPVAVQAVLETNGEVLVYENEVCDARFAKACGGWSENYENAWQSDMKVPYLRAVWDAENKKNMIDLANATEEQIEKFIMSSPNVFCNVSGPLLSQVLVGFDQETKDFFRWKVSYTRNELETLIKEKSGVDIGELEDLKPLERGVSGRLIWLEIKGSKKTIKVGKDLEIRRVLSPSHLYSSCFIIKKTKTGFDIIGAGWGHGVGLCQIGAASMAQRGYTYRQILVHYFVNSELKKLY